MEKSAIYTYLVYAFALIAGMVTFVGSDHLWKASFFRRCLIVASVSGLLGIVLEEIDALGEKTRLTLVVMFVPLIYLGYFQLFRWLFKKWKGTEPYLTSASSTIGAPPLDLFTSANIDAKNKKFEMNRRIMRSDFLFSFLTGLVPAFTILGLITLVMKLN